MSESTDKASPIVEPDERITPVDSTAPLATRKKAAIVVLAAAAGTIFYYGHQVVRGVLYPAPAAPRQVDSGATQASRGGIPTYTYASARKDEASAQPAQGAQAGQKKDIEVVEDINKTRPPAGGTQPAREQAPRPKNPRYEGSVVISDAAASALQPTAAAAGGMPVEPATEAAAVTRAQRVARPARTIARGTPATCTIYGPLDTTFRSMPVCELDHPVYSMAGGHRPLLDAGARLIGKSEPVRVAGQAAGFVEWTEIRDGDIKVTIASPAVDQLGRARIPGETDTHFWQRFGPPALLSVLTGITANVGGAGRSAPGVAVVLPGVSSAGRTAAQAWVDQFSNIAPTFRSAHGITVGLVFDRDVYIPEGDRP